MGIWELKVEVVKFGDAKGEGAQFMLKVKVYTFREGWGPHEGPAGKVGVPTRTWLERLESA